MMNFLIYGLIGGIAGVGFLFLLKRSIQKPPIAKGDYTIYRIPRFVTVALAFAYALFATFTIWSAIDGEYGPTAVFVFFGMMAFIPFLYYSGHSLSVRGEELTVVNGRKKTVFTLKEITGFKGEYVMGGVRVYLADGRNVLLRYEYRGAPYLYSWMAENLPSELQLQLEGIVGDKFLKNEKA